MKKCLAICLSILLLLTMPLSAAAADAKTIKVNKEVTGKMASGTDSISYTFTLSKPGAVSLRFTHDNLNTSGVRWNVTLYDKNNTAQLSMSVKGNTIDSSTWKYYAPKGTYTVWVAPGGPYSWSDTPYKLTVVFTKNTGQFETEGVTNTLTASKKMTGNLHTSSDTDLYKITLKKAGRVRLFFNHVNLNSNSKYWTVKLYDKNNTNYIDADINGSDFAYKSAYYYLPKGTYHVRVSLFGGYWFSPTDYTIQYSYKENTGQYEQEGVTTTLALGKTITGRLINSSNVDTYKIKVSKKGTVSLNFKHTNLNSSIDHWQIRLYNSKGTDLLKFNSKGTDLSKTGKVKLSAGTYYIQVTANNSYYWSSTEYKLKATFK